MGKFGLSVFSSEPEIYNQCKHSRNQKNDESHKVNAFDLLFVDGVENMVESSFLPNDVRHIVHFTETDPDEPKNCEDEKNNGDPFSGERVHRSGYITDSDVRQ